MKQLIFVCFILFLPLALFAQLAEFKIIRGPEKIQANISQVRDVQNRLCAAVQILTDIDNLQYESARGAVQVEVHNGMEIVYLSPDDPFLKIMHPDFNPLTILFMDYNIQLDDLVVIQLAIIDAALDQNQIEAQNQTAKLSISARPGAVVYLDGMLQTKLQNIELLPSQITLRAEMDNAVPEEITLLLKPNDDLEISLFPKLKTGRLDITTFPKDAKVELINADKDYFASTGTYIFTDLPVGEYDLTVKRNGFETINDKLKIAENDTLFRDIKMEPLKGIDAALLTYEEEEKGLAWYWVTLTTLGTCYGVAYFATDGFSLNYDDPGEGRITVIVPKVNE